MGAVSLRRGAAPKGRSVSGGERHFGVRGECRTDGGAAVVATVAMIRPSLVLPHGHGAATAPTSFTAEAASSAP